MLCDACARFGWRKACEEIVFTMPFFSPVSSEQFLVAPLPEPAAVSDKLAALSTDEPLPEAYHVDRIRLLAQSPRRLFLYWELSRSPFEALRRAFGPQAAHYQLVIRLVALESGAVSWHEASPSRSQWFEARPDTSYRAELGLYARGRAFIRLLSSNAVRTPRAGVAAQAALAAEFRVTPEEFARVLDEAGYASDALEVALEAADVATAEAATRAVAVELGGEAAELGEANLMELRGLLVALALGAKPEELGQLVSDGLAGWLEHVRQERSESLRPAHLLEILRTMLGIRLNPEDLAELDEAAAHRAARFIVGASRVNLPRRAFHLWMPSMTVGLLKSMRVQP